MQHNDTQNAPEVRTTKAPKAFTLPTALVASLCFITGLVRTWAGYEAHGIEYAYHAAIPLLPLCLFFTLFVLLLGSRNKPNALIALTGALLTAVLI